MAEARSAVAQPRIVELELDRNTWNDFARAWRRSVVKGFFRFRFIIVYVHSAVFAADCHMTALLAPKISCLVLKYFYLQLPRVIPDLALYLLILFKFVKDAQSCSNLLCFCVG